MGEVEQIIEQIEQLRQLLHDIAIEKGISNKEVLELSARLDDALNAYYKLKSCEKSSE